MNRQLRMPRVLLLALLALQYAPGQVPGMPSAGAPAAKKADADPLGRESPHGSVFGFLRAAEREDYQLAAQYLQVKQPSKALDLARQLRTLLNAGMPDIERLSRFPEGDLRDGAPPTRELVGTVTVADVKLDILLERVKDGDRPAIWLFSAETLRRVPGAVDQIKPGNWEDYIPGPLRTTRLFSVPLYRWLGSIIGMSLTVLLAWLGSRLLWLVLRPILRRITRESDDRHFARVRGPLWLILLAVFGRALGNLALTVLSRQIWTQIAVAVAVVGFTWLVIRISDVVAERAANSLSRRQASSKLAVVTLFHRLFKIAAAIAGGIGILYAIGGDVTTILAGVGLGGVVIALAAQKTLENLFGGVAVISDEPIRVGDFCRFADKLGSVVDIGLRSTRVRTLDRTILSIPNGQLSLMTLENLTLRDKFLFNQSFGLRYETTPDQMRSLLSGIRALIFTHPQADHTDARVRLTRFADSAFTIEVFTYLFVNDNIVFLEIQEELLMSILDIIVAAGSGLAYPSQTLYVTRDKPHDPVSVDQAAVRTRQKNGHPK